MTRDWKIGICGVTFVALALLAYALFGRPPYAFFSLLKFTVAISAGLGAWALHAESKRYLPISLCLVLIGGIHLLGKMQRSQWVLFNWGAVVCLLVLVVILLIDLRRSKSGTDGGQLRSNQQRQPEIRFKPDRKIE